MSGEPTSGSGGAGGRNRLWSFDVLLRNLRLAGPAVRTLALATQPLSLGAFVEHDAARTPDQPALLFEDHRWDDGFLERAGFDPRNVADPLWVTTGDGYERLTPELHDRLSAGAIRL